MTKELTPKDFYVAAEFSIISFILAPKDPKIETIVFYDGRRDRVPSAKYVIDSAKWPEIAAHFGIIGGSGILNVKIIDYITGMKKNDARRNKRKSRKSKERAGKAKKRSRDRSAAKSRS